MVTVRPFAGLLTSSFPQFFCATLAPRTGPESSPRESKRVLRSLRIKLLAEAVDLYAVQIDPYSLLVSAHGPDHPVRGDRLQLPCWPLSIATAHGQPPSEAAVSRVALVR